MNSESNDNLEPILATPESLQLNVNLPGLAPPHQHLYVMREAASLILAANARWMLAVPAIASLLSEAQVLLLQNCWPKLLVLGFAQYSHALPLQTFLLNMIFYLRIFNSEYETWMIPMHQYLNEPIEETIRTLTLLQVFIRITEQVQVTSWEFAYFRALCIFSSSGVPGNLKSKLKVYQDRMLHFLGSSGALEQRWQYILQNLIIVREFSASSLEQLFFVDYTGGVHIEDTVPHLLNAQR